MMLTINNIIIIKTANLHHISQNFLKCAQKSLSRFACITIKHSS